jgi:zinc protease
VFVGTFDPDSLEPLIRTYLGGLPSTGRVESWRDEGIEAPTGVIKKQVYRGIEPKSQTRIMFTGPFEWSRENRYAMASLASVLRIRLREVLREDMGGTYGVGVSGSPSRDPRQEYQFTITFGTAPERLEELTEAVFLQIDSLQRFGPSQEDIDKVKETQRRQRETNLRENGYWLGQLVSADRYDLDPRDILTYERMVDALDVETVQAAAQKYLRPDNYVQVSLYPEKEDAGSQQE